MPEFDPEGADPVTLKKFAIVCLAGWEAQLRHMPDLNESAYECSIEGDMESSRRCVGNAVVTDEERCAMLDECRAEARVLVAENWAAVERVGNALAERRVLSGDKIIELCRLHPRTA